MQQLFYYKTWQKFITKFGRSLLQNASGFFLQNATVLSKNATVTTKRHSFIPKCEICYKMRCLLQIATEDLLLLVQVLLAIFEAFVLGLTSWVLFHIFLCITLIWYFYSKFGFPFFISPRVVIKLIWFFNASLEFILPSVKFINKANEF